MKFIKLEVSNYRNFENIVLDLSNKNVIFGLNDIGKSNLLSVFRLLFDKKYRSNNCIESDYHNKNTEKDIEILLEIELEKDKPTIDDEIVISKIGQCGVLSSEKNNLYIKLIAKFDLSLQAGEPKMFWGEDKNDLSEMQTIFNGYQIDKVFSAIYIKDITENNALFKKNIGKLINNELNEKEDINAIKGEMLDINDKIGNLPSVKELQQNLSRNYNSIKDEKIEICIRSEVGINNLYSNLNTYIKKEEQDNFYPTSGDGRKKLLEYALYTSIAENEQENGNHKIYIYLIEEPENHLHESIQLYLSDQIFNNMKFKYFFLTTHSPSMLFEMDDNTNLVRLYSKDKVECNTFLYSVPNEYQDSDTDMHNFFMYLNENLGINLFVVGDEKQSIYIWRGANPESFMSLTINENFKHYKLSENFRSSQSIKNYAYVFSEEMNMFKITENNEEVLAINCTERQEVIPQIINAINKNKRVAMLTFQKNDAKILAEQFTELGLEMKYIISPPVENISTHDKWLYSSIAKLIYLRDYNIYSFLDDIPFEISRNDRNTIKKYLKQIPAFVNQKEILKIQINALFNILDYKLSNSKFDNLFETINNDIYGNWYNLENIKNVSMTLHTSKGLEFDQVILLAKDFSLNNQENKNLHYVGITRAKEKMIIIFEKNYSKPYLDILVEKMQTLPSDYKMILNMKKL